MIGAGCQSAKRHQQSAHISREDIEWSRVWVTGVNRSDKAHVLLIGDSITEAYSDSVEKRLQEIAYVSRYVTSKSLGDRAYLREVSLILGNVSFEVIHFNNGMHGRGYAEAEYDRDFARLIKLLQKRAPQAKLIGTTTTPKRVGGHLDQLDTFNERIKARNECARVHLTRAGIPINDLYALAESHPEYYAPDGTHFGKIGIDAEAVVVANRIRELLKGGAKSALR